MNFPAHEHDATPRGEPGEAKPGGSTCSSFSAGGETIVESSPGLNSCGARPLTEGIIVMPRVSPSRRAIARPDWPPVASGAAARATIAPGIPISKIS